MRRGRLLLPLVFVWALLGAGECTESTINQQINTTFGIDTDSPAQVAGAILLGQTFGSKEEQRGAEMGSTLKDFRRADHEQKGDKFARDKDYDLAITEYETALQWTGSGIQQDRKRKELEIRLARTLTQEANSSGSGDSMQLAARHYGKAADLSERDPAGRTQPAEVGNLRFSEAMMLYRYGENFGASCRALRKAEASGHNYPEMAERLKASLKKYGTNCD